MDISNLQRKRTLAGGVCDSDGEIQSRRRARGQAVRSLSITAEPLAIHRLAYAGEA